MRCVQRSIVPQLEMPIKNVEGKVAFITGGANGAGLGMAKVFLKNVMKVAIADIQKDSLDPAIAQFGNNPDICAIRMDVANREAFARGG
jgi:NADP-dependent 3-hydroxy acid dehydrogenase YdfG